MKVRHMARYYFPGTLFAEDSSRELPERSAAAAVEAAPDGAFAFVLYDSPICDFEFPADLFRLVPIPQNESRRHYLGGELYTLKQVQAMGEGHRILATNMDVNGWAKVIKTPLGNWQPFEKGDELVKVPTRV